MGELCGIHPLPLRGHLFVQRCTLRNTGDEKPWPTRPARSVFLFQGKIRLLDGRVFFTNEHSRYLTFQ